MATLDLDTAVAIYHDLPFPRSFGTEKIILPNGITLEVPTKTQMLLGIAMDFSGAENTSSPFEVGAEQGISTRNTPPLVASDIILTTQEQIITNGLYIETTRNFQITPEVILQTASESFDFAADKYAKAFRFLIYDWFSNNWRYQRQDDLYNFREKIPNPEYSPFRKLIPKLLVSSLPAGLLHLGNFSQNISVPATFGITTYIAWLHRHKMNPDLKVDIQFTLKELKDRLKQIDIIQRGGN